MRYLVSKKCPLTSWIVDEMMKQKAHDTLLYIRYSENKLKKLKTRKVA